MTLQVGRSGSRACGHSGGRRPGWDHLRQTPRQSVPAPQLLTGDQRKRNQRKGVRDPTGAAGCSKEGVVTYFVFARMGRTESGLKKKADHADVLPSKMCFCHFLLHISGTETKRQGVWTSVASQESVGAGAGGADCQSVWGQRRSMLSAECTLTLMAAAWEGMLVLEFIFPPSISQRVHLWKTSSAN